MRFRVHNRSEDDPGWEAVVPRRTWLDRFMHGVVAISVLVLLGSGYIITDTSWNGIGLLNRDGLVAAHKSIGLLIVPSCLIWALGGLRGAFRARSIYWRTIWIGHAVLAIGILTIAILGWAGSSSGRYGQDVFGILTFPEIAPNRNITNAIWFYDLHETLAWWAMLLLGTHITGALYHLVILRDGRFTDMLTSRQKRRIDR